MNIARLVCGAILSSAVSLAAHGAPVTFTESVTGSGSLGSAFSNQLITISGTADTSGITTGVGLYTLFLPTATITVNGFSPVTLNGGVTVFSNTFAQVAGFEAHSPTFDVLDTVSPAFAAYMLVGAISSSGTAQFLAGTAFATSGGSFVLDSVSGNSTFTAGAPTSGIAPEPASIALFGTGLLAFAGTTRRKFCRA